MTNATDIILAHCVERGIRLTRDGRTGLTIDAPRDALTTELLAKLKVHKSELLARLSPVTESVPAPTDEADPSNDHEPTLEGHESICSCGSKTPCDVPIHGGRSVRRDCGGCGRFLDFTVWYGRTTDRASANARPAD